MSRNAIGARDVETGEVIVHQSGGQAGYHTICGVSLNDDQFAPTRIDHARINCLTCKSIWQSCNKLAASDFEATVR